MARRVALTGLRFTLLKRYKYILMVLLVVVLSLLVYGFRQRLSHLRQWGYLGLAIMSFLGGATVILLPIPSLAFTFAMGAVLNPWLVGLIASSAETLGTLSGFLVGASTREALQLAENGPQGQTLREGSIPHRVGGWIERHGLWAVFAFSALPSPFLDIIGVAAGALRLHLWKFLIACWLGKSIKTMVVAWAGAGMLPLAARWLVR